MDERLEVFKSIITNSDNESEYTDYEKCSKCYKTKGYTCCTEFPCEINALDLVEVTEENIRKLLDTGFVMIDKWEDSTNDKEEKTRLPTTYYLRMRGKFDKGLCFDSKWGFFENTCLALSLDTGCMLPFNNRPYYGRKFNCKNFPRKELVSGNLDSCKSWLPYQDIIKRILCDITDEIE